MVKLEFAQPYLSITKFDGVELPDFSILTGLNGAGKTHLMLGIKAGHIRVDGLSHQEAVYFNYKSFQLDPLTNPKQPEFQQKIQTINQYRNDLHGLHVAIVKGIRKTVNRFTNPVDYAIGQTFFAQGSLDFEETIGIKKDFEIFEIERASTSNKEDVNKLKSFITDQFFLFLQQLFVKAPIITAELNLDESYLKIRHQEILESLIDEFRSSNEKYFEFLKSNVSNKINWFRMEPGDFESIGLFAAEIAEDVKRYTVDMTNNDLKKIRWEKGYDVEYLTDEEFQSNHGQHPLEVLNKVLLEYDCNGYVFDLEGFFPDLGISSQEFVIPIQLIHKVKGHKISLSQLSGGEQTLLAIAFIINKARKGTILPRMILLDEIDSALHPSMVERLLKVIQSLLVDEKKLKVMLVTHSPTTIAFAPEDSIFVVKNESKLELIKTERKEAIEFLSEGFVTLENGLRLFNQISMQKITLISEGNNVEYLKKANSFFGNNQIEIIDNLQGFTGKNQLETLFKFFLNVPHSTKVVIVWDCDVKSDLSEGNNTYSYIFERNKDNRTVTKGIENLFPTKVFKDVYYGKSAKEDGGYHSSLNKKAFQQEMVKNGTNEDFINFKPLFDWLNAL